MNFHEIKKYIRLAEKNGACETSLDVLKSLKTTEEVLSHKDAPYWAYRYARNVLKGPWKEAEDVIKTHPYWAYRYAKNVLNAPWKEAEEIIKTDPDYALNVLRVYVFS